MCLPGRHEQRVAFQRLAVIEGDVPAVPAGDGLLVDADAQVHEVRALVGAEVVGAVCEEGQVRCPLPQQDATVVGHVAAAGDQVGEVLVAHFPAVAVRAVVDGGAPAFAQSWDVGEEVGDAGGE
nr:hypothetical protein [Deinococcus sp. 6YEL10]